MLNVQKIKSSSLTINKSSLFRTSLLSTVFFLLSACGGAVQDHFSQEAPEAPEIEITADARNKWIVNIPDDISAQEYELYWDDNDSFSNENKIILDAKQVNIDIKQLLDAFVNTGQRVFVKIVALWEGKRSGSSNVIEYTVQPDGLSSVSNQTLSGKSEIKWEEPNTDGEDVKYNVYWSTSPDVSLSNYEDSAKDLSDPIFIHDHSEYEDQQTLYYVVDRVEAGVESSLSDVIQVTVTKKPSLDTPENLQAVVNGDLINVSWKAVEGATEYRLYRSSVNNFDLETVAIFESASANYNDSNVISNIDYYYWVEAVATFGSSDISASAGPAKILVNINGDGSALPEFTINDNYNINENETIVTNLTAIDIDSNNLTYSISAGFDVFRLIGNQLHFKEAPDYESDPKTYTLTVAVSDVDNTVEKTITVNVNNVNEPPVFTLPSDSFDVSEDQTFVVQLTASDVDSSDLTFSFESASAGDFRIDSANNNLEFLTLKDFDTATTKIFTINLIVSDNHSENPQTDTQQITVNLVDVNESPQFVGSSSIQYPENSINGYPLDANDPENGTLLFSVSGGENGDLFKISDDGSYLIFKTQPTFVLGGDNDYFVEVTVSDDKSGTPNIASRLYTVQVTDHAEPPAFNIVYPDGGSGALDHFPIPESQAVVLTFSGENVSDNDTAFENLTFTLFEESASTFQLNGNVLSFANPIDFESPDNQFVSSTYFAKVKVEDNTGALDTATIKFIVTNVDEAPEFDALQNNNFVRNVAEPNIAVATVIATDPENQTITYKISPASPADPSTLDAAFFNINESTGDLEFNVATNYEAFADEDNNNVFRIVVEAHDTASSPSPNVTKQAFEITVTDVEESPSFVTQSISDQNEFTGVPLDPIVIEITDPDGDVLNLTLSSTDDYTLFNLERFSGNTFHLSFITPPDYENPLGSLGEGNTYQVTVNISGGGADVSKTYSFSVINENDNPPQFDPNSLQYSVVEQGTDVGEILVSDPDGNLNSLTIVIAPGGDGDKFNFDNATKRLSFKLAPDFEIPQDANTDNIYEVILSVSDTENNVPQTFLVRVTNKLNGLLTPELTAVPLAGKLGDPGRVILKWPKVSGETNGYRIYYAEEAGITPENFRTKQGGTRYFRNVLFNEVPFTLNGLALGTKYHFVVTADNGDEESAQSNQRLAKPYVPLMALNDTGAVTCATDVAEGLACNDPTVVSLFTPQDAHHRQDFSFTKLDENGLPTTGEWRCVQDNITGLIWEVKTTGGLQAATNTYTWYNSSPSTNGGNAGTPNGGACNGSGCDTEKYVDAVNAATLCGANDWRMPTVDELHSLVDFSLAREGNTIDTSHFLNNVAGRYWAAESALNVIGTGNDYAWYLRFDFGRLGTRPKTTTYKYHVRLVRNAP